jgi:hypothetical protein
MELGHLAWLRNLATGLFELQPPLLWQTLICEASEQARIRILDERDLRIVGQEA